MYFLGCHNKMPQAGWLKPTEISFLLFLETRNQEQVISRAGFL